LGGWLKARAIKPVWGKSAQLGLGFATGIPFIHAKKKEKKSTIILAMKILLTLRK